ncbi:hypothetical protein BB560_004786 [Smittium megazygosporum]|uniref:ENTH domain-containing protein n=1 Tax=Smittium megazygosporum TaxID=133381 RepID=A0A2T9Z8D4_9FUNG|nr:hypothetical protein BB560_004786 [Smittium megazygosporum]
MSNAARSVMRSVKNYTMGYTDIQMKVRSATSNSPDSPSTFQMAEIAEATYYTVGLVEILEILNKRLNDKGKYWRHVYKSLVLIDYLLRFGSDKVIEYCQQNMYLIRTLKEFQYIDEQGYDRGLPVRQKAINLTELLMDKDKLKKIRGSRAKASNGYSTQSRDRNGANSYDTNSRTNSSSNLADEEERQLRQAIEESKREAEKHEEQLRSKNLGSQTSNQSQSTGTNSQSTDDLALARALKESAQEAELRKNQQSVSQPNYASTSMFNAPPQNTQQDLLVDLNSGWNSGFQTQPSTNAFGNNPMLSDTTYSTSNVLNSGIPQQSSNFDGLASTQYSSGFGNPAPSNEFNSGMNFQSEFTQPTSSFNPFLSGPQATSQADGAFNVTGQFGDIFDTGSAARPLPPGVNTSDAAARLAEIARNSSKIDPFASLAANPSVTSPTQVNQFASNPFDSSSSTAPLQTNSQPQAAGGYSDVFGLNVSQNSNLVNLDPDALKNNTSTNNTSLNNNPFMGVSSVGSPPNNNINNSTFGQPGINYSSPQTGFNNQYSQQNNFL